MVVYWQSVQGECRLLYTDSWCWLQSMCDHNNRISEVNNEWMDAPVDTRINTVRLGFL